MALDWKIDNGIQYLKTEVRLIEPYFVCQNFLLDGSWLSEAPGQQTLPGSGSGVGMAH